MEFEFTLDTAANPKQIHAKMLVGPAVGDRSKGIFAIDGDRRKLAMGKGTRPADFAEAEKRGEPVIRQRVKE